MSTKTPVAAIAFKADGAAGAMEVELVPLEWLKTHEEVRWNKVEELAEMTLKWGCYTKPLIVDKVTGAILDGHHRHQVAIKLGLTKVPAVLFDYLVDDSITVEARQGSPMEKISKQDVSEMSLSDEVFPAKTTRHSMDWDTPPIMVLLEDLR